MNHTQNVDATELAKFSDIAHRWWDTDGECRPLHKINPLRLAWISDICPLDGLNVLDVGCGGGILAESMALAGANVMGIDLSSNVLRIAELHALETHAQRLDYREVSAESLAKELPSHFDAVTCMEMLEHVPNPASVVSACATLVKPGGWIFFSTLNRNLKSFLLAIVGAEYVLNMLPRGTHEFAKMITPSELAGFCRAAQLTVGHYRGLSFNPITQHYWINNDTSVNYLLAARKE